MKNYMFFSSILICAISAVNANTNNKDMNQEEIEQGLNIKKDRWIDFTEKNNDGTIRQFIATTSDPKTKSKLNYISNPYTKSVYTGSKEDICSNQAVNIIVDKKGPTTNKKIIGTIQYGDIGSKEISATMKSIENGSKLLIDLDFDDFDYRMQSIEKVIIKFDGLDDMAFSFYGASKHINNAGAMCNDFLIGERYQKQRSQLNKITKVYEEQQKRPDAQIGMTKQQVIQKTRWGSPLRVNTTVTQHATREQWVYPEYKFLYFDNGKLVAIQK